MRIEIIITSVIILIFSCAQKPESERKTDSNELIENSMTTSDFEKVTLSAEDGLAVTAEVYIKNESAPWIVLCHQAGFSRGEYREIAPKLTQLGFNCIAIDQRSGSEVNGVKNQTAIEAEKARKGTSYPDAIPDVEAAINYVKNDMKAQKIILWGSSYSASLTFVLAVKHSDDLADIPHPLSKNENLTFLALF